jgi:catechol 2,3-dioxygenase-like lactoylglutathione lyase family enzyme
MAQFYAEVFGWQPIDRDDASSRSGGAGWILMGGPDGGPTVSLQAEPWYQAPTWPEEEGAQTKMMHFEVSVDDLEAAVRLVLGAGERVAMHQPPDRDLDRLPITLDPAGHPFCLCRE